MKKRIFDVIQIGKREDFASRLFDYIIVMLILANISCMFLETFSIFEPYMEIIRMVEAITLFLFCVEYLFRIWTADYLYPQLSRGKAIIRFLTSAEGVIDLLTILPFFYLSGFVVFRMLRVVRIFRLFQINSQYDSFHLITKVLIEKKDQIISSVFIVIILMMASSLGIYHAEHEAQPEAFENAFSGIWWSSAALLTIGYGDICPMTTMGRIMAIITAFLGVGVVAIPTGIISAGFVEQYTKQKFADLEFNDMDDIGEIQITAGHVLEGQFVHNIWEKYGIKVLVVVRQETTIVGTPDLCVEDKDILVVKSDKILKNSNLLRNCNENIV